MKRYGKFFWKMIITNSIIVLMLIILFVAVWLRLNTKSEYQSWRNLLKEISEKNGEQVESVIQEMERITYSLATAQEVQQSIQAANRASGKENYFARALESRRAIERLMQMLSGFDFSKKSISVVSRSGDYVMLNAYSEVPLDRDEMKNCYRIQMLEQSNSRKVLLPGEADVYGRTTDQMFSLVRSISDPYSGCYGYVEMQNSVSVLDDLFDRQIDNADLISVLVYDGVVFYSSDQQDSLWGNQLEALAQLGESNTASSIQWDGQGYFLYKLYLSKYGVTLYSLLSTEQYRKDNEKQVSLTVLLAILLLAVSCVTTAVVNRKLYRPIQELRNRMNYEKFEDLQLGFQEQNGDDEIELFHQAFSNLMKNLARQNDELVQRRMQELETSYRILQSQVNPHFLHNTLSVIGLNGEMHGNPEIMEMCACLTKMMAYSMHAQKSNVLFSDELEHTGYYLTLMQHRYLDRLHYTIEFDEELKSHSILKFILQPLVENCFTHGFKNSVCDYYVIHITGKITENGWCLRIEDNGSGFSEEKLMQIRKEIFAVKLGVETSNPYFSEKAGGIGLVNTYARLLIGMRDQGTISLQVDQSSLGGGLVCITLQRSSNRAGGVTT